jgi:hypothetical protein
MAGNSDEPLRVVRFVLTDATLQRRYRRLGTRFSVIAFTKRTVGDVHENRVVAGPRVLDRFGPVFAMTVAALAGILRWSVMACTSDVTAMALVEPLHGLSFALLHIACMRLIGHLVPANLAATAQAIYGTVAIGATTAMVTLLSGTLYGRFGASGFWVMAAATMRALRGFGDDEDGDVHER